ncbi:MAG: hypothetical protein U0Q16_37520 [Bryobacteraceae bacterium]
MEKSFLPCFQSFADIDFAGEGPLRVILLVEELICRTRISARPPTGSPPKPYLLLRKEGARKFANSRIRTQITPACASPFTQSRDFIPTAKHRTEDTITMRYPATLTIDEMPESERPKRSFIRQAAMPQTPPPAPQPPPEPPRGPGISLEDWKIFKQLLFDALMPFPDARASVNAAFAKMRQALEAQNSAPIGGPAFAPA